MSCFLVPVRPVHAGGCGQNGAGFLCQQPSRRTYWTNQQRAAVEQRGFGGFWSALGEREREMFPNFYGAGRWGMENIGAPALGAVFGPWMQRNVWTPLDQTPPDLGPAPLEADRLVAIGMIGTGRLGQRVGKWLGRFGPPTSKAKVREMIAHGEIYLTKPEITVIKEGFEEVITREAFHGEKRIGGYALSRVGETVEVMNIWTEPAYQGGHLATRAVTEYLEANSNVRYISAAMENEETVRFIEQAIEFGSPNVWMSQALQATPLGKIGAALGELRPVRLQRVIDPTRELPYYDVLVEIIRRK